ncbi:hypothetical protein EHQ58_03040 [Leptospira ognonensis]|uniref:Uncharacterized protein n=2 Tax=Leptospira ognonensis TaxID=2484945 RepID=A0A4R9KBJ5_9LEPT|nr:hypothetical protein EHQ58_03040 [Leptospira ognonensis]
MARKKEVELFARIEINLEFMNARILIPVCIWAILIAVGNYQIISSTNKKIEQYHNAPPFRIDSVHHAKNLNHLVDSRPETEWERAVFRKGEPDFTIEMKLTHFYDGVSFVPFRIKGIEWRACQGKTLPPFTAKLFLRESINVDKELRLPIDKLEDSFSFDGAGKKIHSQAINIKTKFISQTDYPTGIYIYTLEVTLPNPLSPNDCFAEIKLTE